MGIVVEFSSCTECLAISPNQQIIQLVQGIKMQR